MNSDATPERFFEAINAYQSSACIKTSIEIDLFTAIAENAGKATAEVIAARCKVAPKGARVLADHLTLMGFLEKSTGGTGGAGAPAYSLAEDAALFLDRNSPAYLGGAIEFLSAPDLQGHFAALTERVRRGGAPVAESSLTPSHEMWIRFARGMAGLMMMPSQMLAQYTLEMMGVASGSAGSAKGGKAMKILDIAAGHGMFGIAFLQQNPLAQVVAQDWAVVLAVAMEHAKKFGVADRYTTLPGSAFDVPFGQAAYDVVLLPNFLHHFDAATNVALLKKVHGALKPGGLCVALEFAPEEDRLNPPTAGAFALVMLVSTPAGDAYTVKELSAMYREAGFGEVRSKMLGMERVVSGVRA